MKASPLTAKGRLAVTSGQTAQLILTLLMVRLLYGVLAALLLSLGSIAVAPLNMVYIFLTYLITARLIWRERHRLPAFRMGKLAVNIFILAGLFIDDWPIAAHHCSDLLYNPIVLYSPH